MIILNGERLSCAACIRGHRSAGCCHVDRWLISINSRGRPNVDQKENTRLRIPPNRRVAKITYKFVEPKPGSTLPPSLKKCFILEMNTIYCFCSVNTDDGSKFFTARWEPYWRPGPTTEASRPRASAEHWITMNDMEDKSLIPPLRINGKKVPPLLMDYEDVRDPTIPLARQNDQKNCVEKHIELYELRLGQYASLRGQEIPSEPEADYRGDFEEIDDLPVIQEIPAPVQPIDPINVVIPEAVVPQVALPQLYDSEENYFDDFESEDEDSDEEEDFLSEEEDDEDIEEENEEEDDEEMIVEGEEEEEQEVHDDSSNVQNVPVQDDIEFTQLGYSVQEQLAQSKGFQTGGLKRRVISDEDDLDFYRKPVMKGYHFETERRVFQQQPQLIPNIEPAQIVPNVDLGHDYFPAGNFFADSGMQDDFYIPEEQDVNFEDTDFSNIIETAFPLDMQQQVAEPELENHEHDVTDEWLTFDETDAENRSPADASHGHQATIRRGTPSSGRINKPVGALRQHNPPIQIAHQLDVDFTKLLNMTDEELSAIAEFAEFSNDQYYNGEFFVHQTGPSSLFNAPSQHRSGGRC